jgi:hypothetical protein
VYALLDDAHCLEIGVVVEFGAVDSGPPQRSGVTLRDAHLL